MFVNNATESRLMKKSGKLVCHVINSNIAVDTLPTLQISVGVIALFKKIYDGEPILNPDTMALLGNNYFFQMTDTGFAEKF